MSLIKVGMAFAVLSMLVLEALHQTWFHLSTFAVSRYSLSFSAARLKWVVIRYFTESPLAKLTPL
jgi:hypothetical protein